VNGQICPRRSRLTFSVVYEFIHVSQIHNTSIPSDNLLTDETVFQLQTLADDHEHDLAYNASEPIRAIAGSTLAAQVI
jgi:hypothetical protein